MKQVLPLILTLCFAFTAGIANSQTTSGTSAAPLTRDQVKMERDEFMRTHRWDQYEDNWVLKSEVEGPAGVKSRAEVKAARDDFLRNHRWDPGVEDWVPVTKGPRDLGQRSRAQVKAEAIQFLRTHQWDGPQGTWTAITPRPPKAKK